MCTGVCIRVYTPCVGGGGGFGTPKFVQQQLPNTIFPNANCVFSYEGHFGLGGGGEVWGRPPPTPLGFNYSNYSNYSKDAVEGGAHPNARHPRVTQRAVTSPCSAPSALLQGAAPRCGAIVPKPLLLPPIDLGALRTRTSRPRTQTPEYWCRAPPSDWEAVLQGRGGGGGGLAQGLGGWLC